MYPAIKSAAINEPAARERVGDTLVDAVLRLNAEQTSRIIDDCHGKSEFSASVAGLDVDGNEVILTVLYLVDSDDCRNCEDLSSLDWSTYTFEVV